MVEMALLALHYTIRGVTCAQPSTMVPAALFCLHTNARRVRSKNDLALQPTNLVTYFQGEVLGRSQYLCQYMHLCGLCARSLPRMSSIINSEDCPCELFELEAPQLVPSRSNLLCWDDEHPLDNHVRSPIDRLQARWGNLVKVAHRQLLKRNRHTNIPVVKNVVAFSRSSSRWLLVHQWRCQVLSQQRRHSELVCRLRKYLYYLT